jgi:hypothetical protein
MTGQNQTYIANTCLKSDNVGKYLYERPVPSPFSSRCRRRAEISYYDYFPVE